MVYLLFVIPALLTGCSNQSKMTVDDLVFLGTVEKLDASPMPQSKSDWVVQCRVDTILAGEFSGKAFSFRIHSPSKSGLEVGKQYKIEAKRTVDGYTVDHYQWTGKALNKPAAEMSLGLQCHEQGRYTNAVLHFTQAIMQDPSNAVAYLRRGDSYTFLDEIKKAISDYTKGIELNPREASAYLTRGEAYTQIDEYDKAIADYKMALSLNPKLARGYADLGDVYLNAKKDIAAAKANYTKALQLNPMDHHSRSTFATIEGQRFEPTSGGDGKPAPQK